MNYRNEFIKLRRKFFEDEDYWHARDVLIENLAPDHTLDEIGEWANLTRAAVSDILIKRGFRKKEIIEENNDLLADEIEKRAKKGEYVRDIAEALGISEQKVRLLADKRGVTPVRPPKEMPDDLKKRNKLICDMYATGKYTYEELGTHFKLTAIQIGRIVGSQSKGRPAKPVMFATPEARLEELKRLRKAGVGVTQIAKTLRLSPTTIYRLLSTK